MVNSDTITLDEAYCPEMEGALVGGVISIPRHCLVIFQKPSCAWGTAKMELKPLSRVTIPRRGLGAPGSRGVLARRRRTDRPERKRWAWPMTTV